MLNMKVHKVNVQHYLDYFTLNSDRGKKKTTEEKWQRMMVIIVTLACEDIFDRYEFTLENTVNGHLS